MMFNKTKRESIVIYDLKGSLTTDLVESIARDLKEDLENDPKLESVIFDIHNHELDYKCFKTLSVLGHELRKARKQMYALSEQRSIHSLIRREGMDNVFKPILSLNEIKGGAPASKVAPKVDVSFINPFIEGAIHVLNVQCQVQVVPSKPILKSSGSFNCQTDIAGIIGITSKSFHGSIALCFPSAIFLHIMSKMLGEEFKEITEELTDGAAELTNMIFGHAKKILNERGHTIDKALPSVVRGPNLKIDHSGANDSIILPFSMGDMMFFMEIGTEKN